MTQPSDHEPQSSGSDRAPRLARPFVVILLLLVILVPVFEKEPWPLTSFRLFSTVRHDEQRAWRATLVAADGTERAYPLGGMDRGLRGFRLLAPELATATPERSRELCRAWLGAAPEHAGNVAPVRMNIYLDTWRLSERVPDGERALPPAPELKYVCTAEGVEPVDLQGR